MKKRITAFLLMLTILVSMFPVMSVEPKKANAALVNVPGLGMVELLGNSGDNKVCLDANKNLIYRADYHSNPNATVSYHTCWLYFGITSTGRNPGHYMDMGEGYVVDVSDHDSVWADGKSYDTFTVPRDELEQMLLTLFGPTGLQEEQTVYISEIFCLRERPSADIPWNDSHIKYDTPYRSVEEIRGAAGWSDVTKNGFAQYYDVKAKFQLTKYNITVEAETGGDAWADCTESYSGFPINIYADPHNAFEFDGWSVKSGGVTIADIGVEETSFTMPERDVVLLAKFSKKDKPAATATPEPTSSISGSTPIPTPVPSATPAPPYMPETSSRIDRKRTRYYTTGAGITLDGVYQGTIASAYKDDTFGYIASPYREAEQSFSNNIITKRGSSSYSVGTDSSGNERKR